MNAMCCIRRYAGVLLALGLYLLAGAPAAAAQPDTTSSVREHSPRGALWRAAVLPGWGQIYNRQYIKLPFVYGGLAGITATAVIMNREYLTYRRAALYGYGVNQETPPEEFCACYRDEFVAALIDVGVRPGATDEELRQQGNQYHNAFRAQRDIYRRYRDLSYFGIGLVYGLTILDAYVNAHLLDFDVDEDLTLNVRPLPNGIAARLQWRR